MDELLTERYSKEPDGVLNCYDQVEITGNLQSLCYAQGMTYYPYVQGIRVFDYTKTNPPVKSHAFSNIYVCMA